MAPTRAETRRPRWAASIPGPDDQLPGEVQQFLDWQRIQRGRPATTVKAYRQDLCKFVAFMRTQPLSATFSAGVDREVLRRYQIELALVLPHPRTRARALVALRRFLGYAYDEGWTEGELSRHVTVPRYVVGDPHPLATEVVSTLTRPMFGGVIDDPAAKRSTALGLKRCVKPRRGSTWPTVASPKTIPDGVLAVAKWLA